MSIGISELLGVEKMTVEESDFSKTLTISNLEKISFSRKYVHNKYVYPVTFQMYGCGGSIFGLNVKLFNCEAPGDDTNGQFFTILNTYPTGKKVTLKKRINYNPQEYKSMYGIIDYLEQVGYGRLFDQAIQWSGGGFSVLEKIRLAVDFQPQISAAPTAVSQVQLVK